MMAISQLIEQTIAQHIANPRVISYAGTKKDEVQGRFVAANRVYNFVLNRKGVSYSPAGRQDSLVFSALFLERMDAVKRPKIGDRVGNNICRSGKSYQCGKTCISNSWNCRKGVKDVNDARRIASILASTNERLKASVKVSDKAQARGRALFEARKNRVEKPKSKRQQNEQRTTKEKNITVRNPLAWRNEEELEWAVRKQATKMGLKVNDVKLGKLKDKWGHTTVGKIQQGSRETTAIPNVTLNKDLLDLPRELGEFVIIHELTHTLAPNHSKLFKTFMSAYMPDWEEREAKLQQYTSKTQSPKASKK